MFGIEAEAEAEASFASVLHAASHFFGSAQLVRPSATYGPDYRKQDFSWVARVTYGQFRHPCRASRHLQEQNPLTANLDKKLDSCKHAVEATHR